MSATGIVSIATYVTANFDLGVMSVAKDSALMAHSVASTLVTVPRFANPDRLVEIADIASEA
jgi:hypothetical protein